MTAQQIHEKSIRDGQTQIIRRFGSKIAKSRFNIASDRFVPAPAEKIDLAVNRGVNRAMKTFQTAAKPSPARPAAKTATSKSFAGQRTIHRFAASSFAGTRMAF